MPLADAKVLPLLGRESRDALERGERAVAQLEDRRLRVEIVGPRAGAQAGRRQKGALTDAEELRVLAAGNIELLRAVRNAPSFPPVDQCVDVAVAQHHRCGLSRDVRGQLRDDEVAHALMNEGLRGARAGRVEGLDQFIGLPLVLTCRSRTGARGCRTEFAGGRRVRNPVRQQVEQSAGVAPAIGNVRPVAAPDHAVGQFLDDGARQRPQPLVVAVLGQAIGAGELHPAAPRLHRRTSRSKSCRVRPSLSSM